MPEEKIKLIIPVFKKNYRCCIVGTMNIVITIEKLDSCGLYDSTFPARKEYLTDIKFTI